MVQPPASSLPPLAETAWFLTGATASGKTAVGLALAERLGAEIVSMDSMAVYRGMDIGTAKPTPAERAHVPHHLIDIVDPAEDYSVARYCADAHRVALDITERGRHVLFVGGTPLYLKALLRGLFQGPPADWALRRSLAESLESRGEQWLHSELMRLDPVAAERLHPRDHRRVIRALEVVMTAGTPISELQQEFNVGRPASACRVFVLDWPRSTLHERIDRRVEAMFAAGLVEEVRALLARQPPHPRPFSPVGERGERSDRPLSGEGPAVSASVSPRPNGDEGPAVSDSVSPRPPGGEGPGVRGRNLSRTAAQAVGYAEVIDYLAGRTSLDEAVALVALHTRQLAKRQQTWFRSLSECRFVAMEKTASPQWVAEEIATQGLAVQ